MILKKKKQHKRKAKNNNTNKFTNPQIFGTSPFAPADFEAWDPELSRMHLHPQIQIPNAFPAYLLFDNA